MQKINLRDLYPDTYKTDVFVDVAEEVLAAIRGQEQGDAAYERRKFRHKAHYSLNREDGIENDALNRPLTPEEVLERKLLREEVYVALMKLPAIQARRIYARFLPGHDGGRDRPDRGHRPPPRVGQHPARAEEAGASAGHGPII